jgi:hypothetical protein
LSFWFANRPDFLKPTNLDIKSHPCALLSLRFLSELTEVNAISGLAALQFLNDCGNHFEIILLFQLSSLGQMKFGDGMSELHARRENWDFRVSERCGDVSSQHVCGWHL